MYMNMTSSMQSGNWLSRLLLLLGAGAVAVLGFFFLTIALVAGAILAAVVGARLWWQIRKIKRAAAASGPVEGEFVVVERDGTPPSTPLPRDHSRE